MSNLYFSSGKQFIVLAFICYCLSTCNNPEKVTMQPYEGYHAPKSIGEVKQELKDKCVDTIKFKKGQIIADIGAGNGSLEAGLSMFYDSLTFFIQDIDTMVCNQKAINKVVADYQGINKKPFTNKYIPVKGSDIKTNLPDNMFDKIFILWTYSYFIDPTNIMTDVRKKLKSEGLLYVVNPDIDRDSGKQLTSQFGWNASPIEKEISDIIDCGFELLGISRNYNNPENPYIMVFKKKNH